MGDFHSGKGREGKNSRNPSAEKKDQTEKTRTDDHHAKRLKETSTEDGGGNRTPCKVKLLLGAKTKARTHPLGHFQGW